MPPKKELDPDLKKGDVIQAVVIADPFNNKFGPLTTPSKPKVSNYKFTHFIFIETVIKICFDKLLTF